MPVAFIEPTKEETAYIISRMHDSSSLDNNLFEEFRRAMNSILLKTDTALRSQTVHMGGIGQNHYLAIRALCTPKMTGAKNCQIVGQEFFGMNRFFPSSIDIADMEWWAVYENGGWGLHTWNQKGEHLLTGSSGMGDFVAGALKINHLYLSPSEVVSFLHSIKRRTGGNFARYYDRKTLQYVMTQIQSGQQASQRRLRQLEDLGFILPDGSLSYTGRSITFAQEALNRKEYDEQIRKLRTGKLPDTELGPHGRGSDINKFFKDNKIEDLVKASPSYDNIKRFLELERECAARYGISLRDVYLVDWNQTSRMRAPGVMQRIKSMLGV